MDTQSLNDDALYSAINDTALMMRGMTMDPSIPQHAKEAMQSRIALLEGVAQQLYDRMCDEGPPVWP